MKKPGLFKKWSWIASTRLLLTLFFEVDVYRNKHKLNVAVDRNLLNSVTEFFDFPQESILPVLEDIYCQEQS